MPEETAAINMSLTLDGAYSLKSIAPLAVLSTVEVTW